jgi:hypothetical protein
VNRDSVVEVHRIPHVAKRAVACTFDKAPIFKHSTRSLCVCADLSGDRLFEEFTLRICVVGNNLAIQRRLSELIELSR